MLVMGTSLKVAPVSILPVFAKRYGIPRILVNNEEVGDFADIKEERYEKICKMAVRVAKDVRRTKVDAVLDPMPADERKAIHNALAGMNDISTKSEGEGEGRRLHILYTPGKDEE